MIDGCRKYLESNARYFIDVYEGNISSGSPPTWPDGGDSSSEPPMLITSEAVDAHMSQEPSSEDPISPGELREILAEVEGTTPEAIEQGAEEIEIAPPNEADVIEQ